MISTDRTNMMINTMGTHGGVGEKGVDRTVCINVGAVMISTKGITFRAN